MGNSPLRYLRVSVTSRCNLRCIYCRPACGEEGADVLTREEIVRFVRLAVECGIEKVRLTGGEPLVRADIVEIVSDLAATPGLDDLGLTTNGSLLAPLASRLRAAGLRRINIGLSALAPEVYRSITRGGDVVAVLAGLRAALDAGMHPVKVNVVVMRGLNDAEIPALALLSREWPVEVRFIEYMPFRDNAQPPAGSQPAGGYVVPGAEVLERLRGLGEVQPIGSEGRRDAARRYRIAGHKGAIGIIAPHSEPFCHGCSRVRLTADGRLRACLIEGSEQDVLPRLRAGLDRAGMERLLAAAAAAKPALHRGTFRGDMHRIGG